MQEMSVEEMIILDGGKTWKCRFGDFKSSNYWSVYWHAFWSHSLPAVGFVLAILAL